MAKKNKSKSVQTTALLYIIVGILFCVFQSKVLEWLMTIVGALFILSGIIDLIRGNVLNGIVYVVIGVIVIIGGWQFLSVVLIIFGALLALKGLIDLFPAIKRRKFLPILVSIITIVAGAMLIFAQNYLVSWFFIALGVILIIDGIAALVK